MTEQKPTREAIEKLIKRLEAPEPSQISRPTRSTALREEDEKVGTQVEQAVEGAAKIASEPPDEQQG